MQKNSQIVIVEDDKDLCAGLSKALKDESRSIVFILILTMLGVVIPLISYKGLSKASVVERIREIG